MGARRERSEESPMMAVESLKWDPYGCRSPRPRVVDFATVGAAELELMSEGGEYFIRLTPSNGGTPLESKRGVSAEVRQVWRDLTGRT
ncbi:hypothetical protein ACFFR3_45775 [Nonomuraea salmonea]|uniref:DUF397 domain-containing protein n=2 Tax=Nonomuraea salmonea TaxID=46181 RepID=A0ABV5P2R5_9ACTN